MGKLTPFLCLSAVLHASVLLASISLTATSPGVHGLPDGDPERVFVAVLAEEDVTAVAPVPSPVDAPASVESKKAVEEPVTPEPAPEILAREEPEVPPEFSSPPVEEKPEPEQPKEEVDVQPERALQESAPSTPQVASVQQQRRAALGQESRDFQSLLLAAIRQAAFFPHDAIRKKHRGEVVVRFSISPEGKLSLLEICRTSGSSTLDEAAKEIIQRAVKNFPNVPAGTEQRDLSYTIPIRFQEKRSKGSS